MVAKKKKKEQALPLGGSESGIDLKSMKKGGVGKKLRGSQINAPYEKRDPGRGQEWG